MSAREGLRELGRYHTPPDAASAGLSACGAALLQRVVCMGGALLVGLVFASRSSSLKIIFRAGDLEDDVVTHEKLVSSDLNAKKLRFCEF